MVSMMRVASCALATDGMAVSEERRWNSLSARCITSTRWMDRPNALRAPNACAASGVNS